MGYVLKDIANITEPKRVTLAALPNWLQLASKSSAGQPYVGVITPSSATDITVAITDSAGGIRTFTGTDAAQDAGGNVFYISSDPLVTAENLRGVLLADLWLAANFEIFVPLTWAGGVASGNSVRLQSKANGAEYNLTVTVTGAAYNNVSTSSSSDSIRGNAPTADVLVDIYAVDRDHIGGDDRPAAAQLGQLLVTLSKTYYGDPVWFDLNGVMQAPPAFNAPPDTAGWFDAGTAKPYQAVALLGGVNRTPIYASNVLWVVDGYGRLSGNNDMAAYVYYQQTVRRLSNKPVTPYVRGQREYISFILEDPFKGTTVNNYTVSVVARALSTSGALLGSVTLHPATRGTLAVVNTCALDLDVLLDSYPTAGRIEVAVMRGGIAVTDKAEYIVRPECLHDLLPFSFVNRLGGWDAVNFDATAVVEAKPSAETYRRTVTPDYRRSEGVEAVYRTTLSDTVTVTGAPVTGAMADWLKEFAAARVILDGAGRRVLLEDFTLRADDGEMHVPTLKYRLSETYTNED